MAAGVKRMRSVSSTGPDDVVLRSAVDSDWFVGLQLSPGTGRGGGGEWSEEVVIEVSRAKRATESGEGATGVGFMRRATLGG
jgi:hypothetical protein